MGIAERVLLISQNPLTCSLIQGTINSHPEWQHCLLEPYPTINKALQELSVLSYQVVIVDCPSLNISPLELLIQIKGINNKIPIILLNEADNEKIAISCLKSGADYYLIQENGWEKKIPLVMDSVLNEYYQKNSLRKKISQLKSENKTLRENSALDESTLFYSANHFNSLLSRELNRATRYGQELSCLLIEIMPTANKKGKRRKKGNHEKLEVSNDLLSESNIKETYEKLGLLLRSTVRASDIWAKISETRFAALLPNTTAKAAKNAIKRIQSEIL